MSLYKQFREKYLNSHECYLDAIWGILPSDKQLLVLHDRNLITIIENMKETNISDKDRSLRNLSNAWYHESSFLYPISDKESWLKFAPWKIIQFYYTVFCMLSSMVRCIDNSPNIRHKTMINIFTKKLIINPLLNENLFSIPFCFYTEGGILHPTPISRIRREYSLKNDLPQLERCFSNIPDSATKPTSLFHYFKCLREWSTYEDSYIFINLYGPVVKENLYRYLHYILNCFLFIGEQFLITFWGNEVISKELEFFLETMANTNKFEPKTIISRFEEYSLL